MRIHKAIENIQAAIDRHQDEWLKENGYEPEEHVRKRTAEPKPPVKTPKPQQTGQFLANRFLGAAAAKPEPEPTPEPEPITEQELTPEPAIQPEPAPEPEIDIEAESEPAEIVSVIEQKEKHHQGWEDSQLQSILP